MYRKYISLFYLGMLSSYTVAILQHLKEFFGITFKIEYSDDQDIDKESIQKDFSRVKLTCVGIGYKNTTKRVT